MPSAVTICPFCEHQNEVDPTEETLNCSQCGEAYEAQEMINGEPAWQRTSEYELLASLSFLNAIAVNFPWAFVAVAIFTISCLVLLILRLGSERFLMTLPVKLYRTSKRLKYYPLEYILLPLWMILLGSYFTHQSWLISTVSICIVSFSFLMSFQARTAFALSYDQRSSFEELPVKDKLKLLFFPGALQMEEENEELTKTYSNLDEHFIHAAHEKKVIDNLNVEKQHKTAEHHELDQERESWESEVASRYEDWISKESVRLKKNDPGNFR